MNPKDMEDFIEGLSSLFKLKRKMEKEVEGKRSCCREECDEEEEEDICPFIQELEIEYKKIILWAVGTHDEPQIKKKAKRYWLTHHPDLPMPRLLKSDEVLNSYMSTICLLIDVIPLYLADKNKCAG
jgi:hypothetical protein